MFSAVNTNIHRLHIYEFEAILCINPFAGNKVIYSIQQLTSFQNNVFLLSSKGCNIDKNCIKGGGRLPGFVHL